ncbi:MAG: SCO family protein [candidate division WOR-3 bacterium]
MFNFILFFLIINETPEVGVVEKIGSYLPGDIYFVNSEGKEFTLKDISLNKKPFVLVPVFYSCKMVCPMMLNEIVNNLEKITSKLGKDFYIIVFSFDLKDDVNKALEIKKEYFLSLNKNIDENGFNFTVLKDSSNLYRLTMSLGFYFKKENGTLIHPSSYIFISPDLKIVRYIYGPELLPLDFELALHEASEGKLGGIRVKATRFCFNYDPKGRKYVFNFIKVFMTFSMIFVISFALFLTLWIKKGKRED